jgi:peptidoglycan LD-endopeptidase CwlK
VVKLGMKRTQAMTMQHSDRLIGVHPDLVRVVEKANEALPLFVIEGVRSDEQCYRNYGKGRTAAQCRAKGVPESYANPKVAKVTWLNNPLSSKHRKQTDGYSHAVDLGPVPLDWNNGKGFAAIAKAMLAAAKSLGIKIRWGADWNANGKSHEKGETDSPHFELVR